MTTSFKPGIDVLVECGIDVGTFIDMTDPATGAQLSGTIEEMRWDTKGTSITLGIDFLTGPTDGPSR